MNRYPYKAGFEKGATLRTAYDQIYRDLKQDIENGTYAYDSLLPSQSTLVGWYGCAHNTARKAISLLANEGYCLPIHGKGVRVIYRPVRPDGSFTVKGIESFSEAAKRNGVSCDTKVIHFEEVICDEEISRRTDFATGEKLLKLDAIRMLEGRPLIRESGYVLARLVKGITPEDVRRSVYDYIEQGNGKCIATSKRSIVMERVRTNDRELLDLEGCDYLCKVIIKTYDTNARLFEYRETRMHPDQFRFDYTSLREKALS